MRLDATKSGVIDDFVVTASSVRLLRAGAAKYRMAINGEADLVLELWTTQKSRLTLTPNEPPPRWIRVLLNPAGEVEGLDAEACEVHLEQMDRRSYMLGLYAGNELWGLHIASEAYAKARVVDGKRVAG